MEIGRVTLGRNEMALGDGGEGEKQNHKLRNEQNHGEALICRAQELGFRNIYLNTQR